MRVVRILLGARALLLPLAGATTFTVMALQADETRVQISMALVSLALISLEMSTVFMVYTAIVNGEEGEQRE